LLTLLFESLGAFHRAWKRYLLFGLFDMLLTSFVFLPLRSAILHRLLLTVSSGVLVNSKAYLLFFDLRGWLGILVLMVMVLFFVFIEMGTLILMSEDQNRGRTPYVSSGFIRSLQRFPRILGIDLILMALILFVILPLIRVPIRPQALSGIALPEILTEWIGMHPLISGMYWIILGALAYWFLRGIFTLHGCLVDQKSLREAFKTSLQRTRRGSLVLVTQLILFNMVLFLAGTVSFAFLAKAGGLVGSSTPSAMGQMLVMFSGVLTMVSSVLLMPLNMIFLTRLHDRNAAQLPSAAVEAGAFEKKCIQYERSIYQFFGKRKSATVVLMAVVLLLSYGLGSIAGQKTIYGGRPVEVVSHRAVVEDEVENSLEAIRASLEAGIDAVGIDVQMTLDGVIVLHHDRSLKRIHGVDANIDSLTYDELNELMHAMAHPTASERIQFPTLAEALALIDGEMELHIDCKTYGKPEELAKGILEQVVAAKMQESVVLQSFDRDFHRSVEALSPAIRTSQILYFALGDLNRLEADDLTIHRGMLDHDLVGRARYHEKGIWVWTLNTEDSVKEALQYDIDGIITDRPLMVMEILGRGE